MKHDFFECAFCSMMATGYGFGAIALTVLVVRAIIS